ncbi:hexokinase HKDC1-like [Eucyclogobius newberryi]|uniref:hexokinase HKDC1-like n=1 Tax=Eucyclogobius newberryi TaxID=166745 RepID=UPI003B5B09DD
MFAVHFVSFIITKLQEKPINKVDELLRAMCLQDDQLKDVSLLFQAEMIKGLSSKSRAVAAVKMLPTHVCSNPNSTERGPFLALDLGESTFKIQRISLGDGMDYKEVKIQEKIIPIPKQLLNDRADELFNFVSRSLKQFMHEKNISLVRQHPLTFTFSFPCEQPALNQGVLLNWTKNVRTPGLRGKDVAHALKSAIERTGGMDIDIVALVNDSVATMMTCRFDDPQCDVGLIIGTGTNACYMEELRHIDLVEGDEGQMCINIEWGAFGDDGALDNYITEFDKEVDAASTNPGIQSFEKMVSSMYLGELVRLVVLKMAKQGLLFKGCVSNALKTKGKITSSHIAAIEDAQRGLQNTKDILMGLDFTPSVEDCLAVQHVSTIVTNRSSSLIAACLSAILTRIKPNRRSTHVTVAVDGELYKRNPQYSTRLQSAVQKLIPETCVRFVTSPCGTGTGAALITVEAKQAAWKRRQVDETASLFKLSQEQLSFVKSRMRVKLESETNMSSFVYNLPNGTESGQYLGLELGGTRVRAVLVNIRNGQLHYTNLYHKIYELPPQLLHTSGEEFFDHVAQCISDFLDFVGMKHTCLPAALTVSFPCEQTTTDKGNVLNWIKRVKATSGEGQDVVTMLREATDRHATFDLDVVAVVNETVGMMIASAHDDPQCKVGLIVGSGVSVCYMEELKNIKYALKKENFPEMKDGDITTRMCIITECGRIGDNGSLDDCITPYDIQVDLNSLHHGKKRFEKLTSGLHVGEVVRQVLLDLSRRGLLFKGHENTALKTPGLFHINSLSQIDSGRVGVLQVRSILQQLGVEGSCDDCAFVKEVCGAVSRRAAQLCGAVVAAVVDQMRENRGSSNLSITVAADGELYKLHPQFSILLKETVKSLAPQCTVTFLTSEEGSGKGAVLVAATTLPKQKT